MSATATQTATLACLVGQALTLRVPGEGLRDAEDRGFEPRRVVTPNRISSVLTRVPGPRSHVRDGTETQARRAGKAAIAPSLTGNARRVRTRNGHAGTPGRGHAPPPAAATSAMIPLRTSPAVLSLVPAARAFATSGYCNSRASPIAGRQALRVRDHGSRNGTGCGCSGANQVTD